MKKYGIISILFLVCAAALSAQQITRFAVVDTSRIYSTFLRDARSVRDYQAKQAKYQAETQRMSDEIITLRQKKVDAEAAGKKDAVQKAARDFLKLHAGSDAWLHEIFPAEYVSRQREPE